MDGKVSTYFQTPTIEERQRIQSDEAGWWHEFRLGNRWALSCIYQQYVRILFRYGIHLCPDEGLVEDCIQDLFVDLWKKREHLSETDSIKYYLFRSLRRRIARKATQKRQGLQYGEPAEFFPAAFVFSHEEELIQEQVILERKQGVQKAMDQLTKRQREAIFLRYYSEMEYEEIASVMALNVQSVYNLVHQSLLILKKSLLARWLVVVVLVIGSFLI